METNTNVVGCDVLRRNQGPAELVDDLNAEAEDERADREEREQHALFHNVASALADLSPASENQSLAEADAWADAQADAQAIAFRVAGMLVAEGAEPGEAADTAAQWTFGLLRKADGSGTVSPRRIEEELYRQAMREGEGL